MVVMEFSCVPVPDIGEGRAADQKQDSGNGEDAFHGEAPYFYESLKPACILDFFLFIVNRLNASSY